MTDWRMILEMIAAISLCANGAMVDTHNTKSAVVFRAIPFIIAVFLIGANAKVLFP